ASARRPSALAGREGAPRHLRGHARAGGPAPAGPHPLGEPAAGRRLDRHRPSGHDRRRHPLGPQGCGIGAAEAISIIAGMNQMVIAREGTIAVDKMLGDATAALLKSQRADGHWVFELEADATIPSEYVLLVH